MSCACHVDNVTRVTLFASFLFVCVCAREREKERRERGERSVRVCIRRVQELLALDHIVFSPEAINPDESKKAATNSEHLASTACLVV